jgi:PAS domain S-box-containing protein
MKISSVLRLIIYVPMVMAAVVIVTLLLSYQQMSGIQSTGDNVRQIRNSITDINQSVFSYILLHEDLPKVQFAEASDTLTRLVSVTHTANQQQHSLLASIQHNNLAMKADFSRLVANYDNRSAMNPEDFESSELIIAESLINESQLADDDATLLRSLVDAGIGETQVGTIVLVISAVFLTALAVTPFLIRTRRRITKSLSGLIVGAAAVGSGNLDIVIAEKGNDEFADVSSAFNRMTSKLKTVTASKTELEREIEERRKAEENLSQATQRLAAHIERSPLAVIEFDSDFRIIRWSKEAEHIFGWTSQEVIGRAISEMKWVYQEDVEKVERVTDGFTDRSNPAGVSVNRNYRKDGAVIWCEWYNSSIYDSSGKLISVLSQVLDITARKKAQESLKESEQRWATTLESIGDAVIATDTAGKITFINSVAENLTGWTLMEALGKPVEAVFKIINEQTRQTVESPVAKVIRTGLVVGLANHTSLVRKDGTEIPIDDSGAPITTEGGKVSGVVLVFRDVTMRRKAEQNVQLLADQWQLTFDSITDLVSIQDNDFNLVRVNKAYLDTVKMSAAEVIGRKCYEIMHGLKCPLAGCPHQLTLQTHAVSVAEYFEPKLGIYVEASTSPIFEKNGNIVGSVHITKDITERKKIEELKDDFIGMVSHELRTPLTIITGAVHTAMLEGLPEDERDMLLKDAAVGAESLGDILSNLLELSRFQARRLALASETVNVRNAINEVVEQLKRKSNAHQLVNEAPEGITLQADKVRIERILHNLMENAIKYSPEGGDIRITARQDDGAVLVGVFDQGIGISAADQTRLFQPFERLEKLTDGIKGLGLGLVVCRRLVEAHGGRMWVESEEGKGSAFYFSLPMRGESKT